MARTSRPMAPACRTATSTRSRRSTTRTRRPGRSPPRRPRRTSPACRPTSSRAGTPEQLAAVREARGEIATLQAMRENVVNGGGPWEHATPEQREQQIKLLDDQIRSTATDALDQHRQSQPELAPSAPRTPEEIAERRREVAAAREQTAARDRQLVQ